VATHEVSKEHGKALRDLFSARILADYRFGMRLDAGTGRALLARAEAFVDTALSLLEEMVGSAG
jgi:NaMN:DMB phosphoribosyltransferase